ncbi:MAG: amylo-alpha-1,6-glucosidase [Armatimonadota bacterium]|nr:amylo-alpha-1,6-glucosidase [Armatimonadota bacterium]MDR7453121.1 amylo-alpha-1,6-glucosidase [Armatimonadota bacterium]MDR7456138.1 amylo-alpha-1,6-glucosidase [Armatimonadota bacterium]MDR7497891.1 amylo-alpha-1,6-glucosidase [Armatimonadota bacterium]MDR7511360.1 amylo-alpha-1,6-glucosidase [Armatimonadota bacterium]
MPGVRIRFGRAVCGDLAAGLRREWLVTNGLGGYASGTLAGPNTRRYHGLLVAALPAGRTVTVTGLVEWVTYDAGRYPLSAHEFADGTIHPDGYRHLEAFALDGMLPVWTFALADARLERRVWMEDGANTTYIRYHVVRATRPVDLELVPLVTCRDAHTLARAGGRPAIAPGLRAVDVRMHQEAPWVRLVASSGQFTARPDWYWRFWHREEAARGLDDQSDLFTPGAFTARLAPGEALTLICTTESLTYADGPSALDRARARQERIVARAESPDALTRQLALAADQFLVRCTPAGGAERGVIAGYHWFGVWGRDTMLALPGLALATRRPEDAAEVLRAFAAHVQGGLLPNRFSQCGNGASGYETADAALWYVLAVRAYREANGEGGLLRDLLPVLHGIMAHYELGTRFGIGADPADGLLRAGEPGVAVTWMDARVGGRVITPRIGKPVELNALWYNALRAMVELTAEAEPGAASRYAGAAARAHAAFRARFARPGLPYLADVVDGPDGDDMTLRPNQVLAVSLPYPLLDREHAAALLEVVGRRLLVTCGLRTLDPATPAYVGRYEGPPARRDEAYHQGTVWAWLAGPFAEARYRVTGDPDAARAVLEPFADHLTDAGLGTISEIMDGDAPHAPRGCIAQAWSVAEVLRAWRLISEVRP